MVLNYQDSSKASCNKRMKNRFTALQFSVLLCQSNRWCLSTSAVYYLQSTYGVHSFPHNIIFFCFVYFYTTSGCAPSIHFQMDIEGKKKRLKPYPDFYKIKQSKTIPGPINSFTLLNQFTNKKSYTTLFYTSSYAPRSL